MSEPTRDDLTALERCIYTDDEVEVKLKRYATAVRRLYRKPYKIWLAECTRFGRERHLRVVWRKWRPDGKVLRRVEELDE
jgi:2'-5' RNA ligase